MDRCVSCEHFVPLKPWLAARDWCVSDEAGEVAAPLVERMALEGFGVCVMDDPMLTCSWAAPSDTQGMGCWRPVGLARMEDE